VFHRVARRPFHVDMLEVGGSNPPGPTKIKKVYTVDMVYI